MTVVSGLDLMNSLCVTRRLLTEKACFLLKLCCQKDWNTKGSSKRIEGSAGRTTLLRFVEPSETKRMDPTRSVAIAATTRPAPRALSDRALRAIDGHQEKKKEEGKKESFNSSRKQKQETQFLFRIGGKTKTCCCQRCVARPIQNQTPSHTFQTVTRSQWAPSSSCANDTHTNPPDRSLLCASSPNFVHSMA